MYNLSRSFSKTAAVQARPDKFLGAQNNCVHCAHKAGRKEISKLITTMQLAYKEVNPGPCAIVATV